MSRGAGKGATSGAKKKAKEATLGEDNLLPGEAEAKCTPKATEKVHGIFSQFSPGCARGEEMPGCVAGTKCQKCYLKGTPAETQASTMGWCRASVCEHFGTTGCKGEKAKKKMANLGRVDDKSGGRNGGKKRLRRKMDVGGDGEDEEARVGGGRRGGRRVGPKTRFLRRSSAHLGTSREVGSCLPSLGDAKRGRFQFEDRSCLDFGERGEEDDVAGCVEVGKSSCRFCRTHGKLDVEDSEEDEDVEDPNMMDFGTCPRDVCRVHDLRWKQCDPM